MTKSSLITNRLSIAMAGLIVDYLFSSDYPALVIGAIYNKKYRQKYERARWMVVLFSPFLY